MSLGHEGIWPATLKLPSKVSAIILLFPGHKIVHSHVTSVGYAAVGQLGVWKEPSELVISPPHTLGAVVGVVSCKVVGVVGMVVGVVGMVVGTVGKVVGVVGKVVGVVGKVVGVVGKVVGVVGKVVGVVGKVVGVVGKVVGVVGKVVGVVGGGVGPSLH